MITREIKAGDRLREKHSRRIVTVRAISQDGLSLWDMNGTVWRGPIHEPGNWQHIDEPQAEPQADAVNHPPHYTAGEIECIDAIRAALGREGFIAYCRGNAIKYLWRCEHKGGTEDLRKAAWYLDRAIKDTEE